MTHKRKPRTETNVINPRILRAAREMVKRLSEQGHACAIVGGLAVNHHGYKRTTGDVDILITADAVSEIAGASLGGEVSGKTLRTRTGVIVDLIFPREGEEFLESAIRGADPYISKETLVYMKLVAGRMKDTADVVELIKRGKLNPPKIESYLRRHRPDLVEEFRSLVGLAESEAD